MVSTGYSDKGQAKDVLSQGAQGFMQKPFTLHDMLRKVRAVLDDSQNHNHRLFGFRGLVYCTLFPFWLSLPLSSYPIPRGLRRQGTVPVFIELRASDTVPTRCQDAVRRVEAHGGRCLQRFPYRTCLGDVPPTQLEALSAEAVWCGTSQGPLDRAALVAPDDKCGRCPGRVESRLHQPAAVSQSLRPGKGTAAAAELRPLPPARPARPQPPEPWVCPPTRRPVKYMIGSVAVGIIMPESSGSIDPSSEDWTTARQDQVVAEIGNALNWWAQREPRAHLSFTWHVERSVPTGYEPITRPQSDERLWIGDVMSRLGYNSADYRDSVWSYDNALRTAEGTNWAFTIFVVDDVHDLNHMFADYLFAYAYVGGPFMVLTYNNDGYGISNMDAVTAHEMGHIFYALDEYAEREYLVYGAIRLPERPELQQPVASTRRLRAERGLHHARAGVSVRLRRDLRLRTR